MKKRTMMMVAAMVITGMLSMNVAAATTEDIIGTWYLNVMSYEGAEMDPAAFDMEVTLEIKEDGTAVAVFNGEEETDAWTLDGDTLKMEMQGDATEFQYEDGYLIVDQDGVGMKFGKEKEAFEGFEPGDIVESPELSDFNGTWNATMIDMDGSAFIPVSAMEIEMTVTIEDGKAMIKSNDGFDEVEKELEGALEGNILVLKNTGEEETVDFYYDTDILKLRLHESGVMSHGLHMEEETEEAETAETEEDAKFGTASLYFEKQ